MTYRLAVLGDPIEHSISPDIHAAAFGSLGLEVSYSRVRADVGILETHLDQIRRGELTGINVTMPLKSAAASLADELTPIARLAGSANTLTRTGTKVIGHSTDADAVSKIVNDKWPGSEPILVLGSGGAAAAVIAALSDREIYIGARSLSKAQSLAASSNLVEAVPWGVPVVGSVLVNATPLGMHGEQLPRSNVESAAGLVDLAYGRSRTPAVAEAAARGIEFVDGVEFLVWAASASFELWTRRVAPVDVMMRAARAATGRNA